MSHSPSTACTQCATVNEQRLFTKARDDKKVRLQAPDVMAAHVPTVLPLRLYASLVRRGMSHLPFTACTQLICSQSGKGNNSGPCGVGQEALEAGGQSVEQARASIRRAEWGHCMGLSYNHLFVALYKVAHKDEDAHDLALCDALHITASHLHINHNGLRSLWGAAPGMLLSCGCIR